MQCKCCINLSCLKKCFSTGVPRTTERCEIKRRIAMKFTTKHGISRVAVSRSMISLTVRKDRTGYTTAQRSKWFVRIVRLSYPPFNSLCHEWVFFFKFAVQEFQKGVRYASSATSWNWRRNWEAVIVMRESLWAALRLRSQGRGPRVT